eukprot:scaffold26575_cov166-Cylindrotheca_fusiformis.AAC.1
MTKEKTKTHKRSRLSGNDEDQSETDETDQQVEHDSCEEANGSRKRAPEQEKQPNQPATSSLERPRNLPTNEVQINHQEQVEELGRAPNEPQNQFLINCYALALSNGLASSGVEERQSRAQAAARNNPQEHGNSAGEHNVNVKDSVETSEESPQVQNPHPNPLQSVAAEIISRLLAEHQARQQQQLRGGIESQANTSTSTTNNDDNPLLAALRQRAEQAATPNSSNARNVGSDAMNAELFASLLRQRPSTANPTSGLATGFLGRGQMQIPGSSDIGEGRDRLSGLLQRQVLLQQLSAQHDQHIRFLASLADVQQYPDIDASQLSSTPRESHPFPFPHFNSFLGAAHAVSSGSMPQASLPTRDRSSTAAVQPAESQLLHKVSQTSSGSSSGNHEYKGHPPIPLATDADSANLSPYQCLLRQQIELFETREEDIAAKAQGRNVPIRVGQVGIRCRYCATLPRSERVEGGAVFYTKTINGIYQVSLNMSRLHFLTSCTMIPENVKKSLEELKQLPRRPVKGRQFWRESLLAQGIVEDTECLRFNSSGVARRTKKK